MSVLAAGCRVGVEDDGSPSIGGKCQRLHRSPRHRGRAAASVDYRASALHGDRAHGEIALRSESCVRPVEVGAVIVHVHGHGEDFTFAADLGGDGERRRRGGLLNLAAMGSGGDGEVGGD